MGKLSYATDINFVILEISELANIMARDKFCDLSLVPKIQIKRNVIHTSCLINQINLIQYYLDNSCLACFFAWSWPWVETQGDVWPDDGLAGVVAES